MKTHNNIYGVMTTTPEEVIKRINHAIDSLVHCRSDGKKVACVCILSCDKFLNPRQAKVIQPFMLKRLIHTITTSASVVDKVQAE